MSALTDFKPGQRVAHISMGDGTVSAVDARGVHVRFDKWKSEGVYDENWFRHYPTYLFHRTAADTSGERDG